MCEYDNQYTAYYYEVACSHSWASQDENECGCKGRGWWLSDLDTWHRCPVHGAGVAHPESYEAEEAEETLTLVNEPVADIEPEDDLPF